jgi:hypothetical protein
MLRRKWQGLVEIGHSLYRDGDWEGVVDVTDAMERLETVELPRARAQTRAERMAAAAARRADPDDVAQLRVHDDAPMGWVGDPDHRARMSPALLRRIQEDDAREAVEAARQERARAQLAAQRQDDAIMESWRSAVAAGTATVADLAGWKLETVGRTPGEALQAFSAAQDAEDARLAAAAARYGAKVAAVFGADGDKALDQLLDGKGERPGWARLAKERGA